MVKREDGVKMEVKDEGEVKVKIKVEVKMEVKVEDVKVKVDDDRMEVDGNLTVDEDEDEIENLLRLNDETLETPSLRHLYPLLASPPSTPPRLLANCLASSQPSPSPPDGSPSLSDHDHFDPALNFDIQQTEIPEVEHWMPHPSNAMELDPSYDGSFQFGGGVWWPIPNGLDWGHLQIQGEDMHHQTEHVLRSRIIRHRSFELEHSTSSDGQHISPQGSINRLTEISAHAQALIRSINSYYYGGHFT